jgi:hypothetical protein
MARPKSALRRALTMRHLTWTAARLAVRAVPRLEGPLNFFPDGVAAVAAGGTVLEDRTWREPLPFAGEMLRFVTTDCARYDKLAPEHVRGDPEARLTRQAVLLSGAEIQGHTGSIVQPAQRRTVNPHGRAPNWNFAKPALLRDGGRIAGRAFFTYRTAHYYHFLMDNALRLVDAIEGGLADAPLTVVRHDGAGMVQDAFYGAVQARWPTVTTRTLTSRERIRPDEVLWSMRFGTNHEWAPFAPARAATLAGLFRAAYGQPAPAAPGRLVFLSRGEAKLRRLTNEDDLVGLARARGFEVFVARGDNHPDQVRMFSEARAVIAVHGAGLANLLFAQPGTAVLEIFPANFTKSTFAWIAARMRMRYHKLVGGTGNYDQAFAVDPAAFAGALDALLGGAP